MVLHNQFPMCQFYCIGPVNIRSQDLRCGERSVHSLYALFIAAKGAFHASRKILSFPFTYSPSPDTPLVWGRVPAFVSHSTEV